MTSWGTAGGRASTASAPSSSRRSAQRAAALNTRRPMALRPESDNDIVLSLVKREDVAQQRLRDGGAPRLQAHPRDVDGIVGLPLVWHFSSTRAGSSSPSYSSLGGFLSSWSPPSTIAAARQAAHASSPHHQKVAAQSMSAIWFTFKAKQQATSRPRPSPPTPISQVRTSSKPS